MAGKKDAGVRRRNLEKNKKKNQKGGDEKQPDAPPEPPEETEETVWKTLSSHWLIRMVVPLSLLYAAVLGQERIQEHILQDPQSINQWLPSFLPPLRDSVANHEERQLLVVGTMSSGTRQIADQLSSVLGLEMGHERSDTQSQFVRDGTVSWIFGIRFLKAPPVLKIAELCQQPTLAMGFHPRMYRGGICSQDQQWSRCWAQECVDILQMEWGCALKPNGCRSFQPFRRSLHQTRKPMAVIESLVSKFCTEYQKQKDFVRISSLLFHDLDFDPFSCLEAVTHHVVEYNRALLRAREKGLIHGMYKIEEATPCQVAELAGLGSDVVYGPTADRFQTQCRQSSEENAPGHQLMKPKRAYKENKGRVRYSWSDFEGGKHGSARSAGDMSLVEELKKLTRDLGYNVEK